MIIYDKNDRRRLYWLIDEYLSGNIDESTFCDEFYYSYSLEIDPKILSDIERKVFSELDKVASRFSQHEEDHAVGPRAYSTVEELKQKIIETKEKLKLDS
ncbi:hypothetical protein HY416_01175 [Candidatus Kaiserbacteria bacterium]|nr:hypothetical protein [Candidatus Kaiserbacteria bacterium]